MDLTLLSRAVGSVAAASLGLWLLRRDRPPDSAGPFGDLLGAVLAGLAAGRLAYVLAEGIDLLGRPLDFVMVRGGIAPGPAALAALGYLAWTCRSNLAARMDHLAPAALLGLAVWEAGCWWQGACLGTPSELWWAVALPGSEVTRHPVGLYAAVLLAAGAVWLLSFPLPRKGATAAAGLGWASAIRLAVPLWSVGAWSNWTWWYLSGLMVGLLGLAASFRFSEGTSNTSTLPGIAKKRASRHLTDLETGPDSGEI